MVNSDLPARATMAGALIFIGGTQVIFPSNASHPTVAVVAGLIIVIAGGVMLFSSEYGHRKSQKAARRPADGDPAFRIPPAAG